MRHYVVVEAGLKVGFGHLTRQFALLSLLGLEQEAEVLILLDSPASTAKMMTTPFPKIRMFSDEVLLLAEIKYGSVVFFDAYHFDIDRINILSKAQAWKMVVCSDINFKIPNCTLLINHLPWVKTKDFAEANVGKFLLGAEYAVLRTPFYSITQVQEEGRILICLGGSSVQPIIETIFEALLQVGCDASKIDVISTSPMQNAVITNSYYQIGAAEVQSLIAKSSYCFITPGNISYEVFSVGRKAIMGSITKEQLEVSQKMAKMNLCFDVGLWDQANFRKIGEWIEGSEGTQSFQQRVFNKLDSSAIGKEVLGLFNN